MNYKTRYYLFLLFTGLAIGGFLAINGREFTDLPEQEVFHKEKKEPATPEKIPESKKEEKIINTTKTENLAPPAKSSEKRQPINCEGTDFDLAAFLTEYAEAIEVQKILYNSQPLSDCSGIFLRLCRDLKEVCSNFNLPQPKNGRDGRRLAKWFYDQDRLILIQDARSNDDLIRPGAVMFYGRRNKTYAHPDIKQITASEGVEHMGVVTAVKRDAEGQVVNYTLFHGRSTGKIASRTTHHHRDPSREDIPAYGNWNQQWVAVAYLD